MLLNIIAALPVFVSILLLLVAYRLFVKGTRFKAWFRGTAVTLSVLFAVLIFISIDELATYRHVEVDRQIATLALKKKASNHFSVRFFPEGGVADVFELFGDQWQVDAKIIKWSPLLEKMGMDASYRFERISGRYEKLEQQLSSTLSAHSLNKDYYLPDVWGLSAEYPWFPGVAARYGSGTYVPMVDKAKYGLYLRHDGLHAKPLNDIAMRTLASWN